MTTLLCGGSGFVGLNIAEALLAAGRRVVILDRSPPPPEAASAFAALPGSLEVVTGDVRDEAVLAEAIRPGLDAIVLGAAITADAARDAREPEQILAVNLLAPVAIVRRAREAGVRRIVNLSSAAAYGRAAYGPDPLREDDPTDPEGLYALTKFASERVLARLSGLWGLDAVSVRLTGVFGPWERDTGLRDTLSPQAQILAHRAAGTAALLARPGFRDWSYAPDVAAALLRVLDAPKLPSMTYNISGPFVWSALAFGERLAALGPGFACRLAGPGETPNVELHSAADRAPLDTTRLAAELGFRARFDLDASVADLLARERAAREGAASR